MIAFKTDGSWLDGFSFAWDSEIRYDSNFELAPDDLEQGGFVYSIAPSISFYLVGSERSVHSVDIQYQPTVFYVDVASDTSVAHDSKAVYQYNGGRTRLTVTGGYRTSEGLNGLNLSNAAQSALVRETGYADVVDYFSGVSLIYGISPLLTGTFSSEFSRSEFDSLNDASSWQSQAAVLYGEPHAALKFGPYLKYENVDAVSLPVQNAWESGGLVKWNYSDMTSFFARAGVDSRSFEGPTAVSSGNEAVWSLGANWSPDEMFDLQMSLDRKIAPSFINDGQNQEITSLSVSLNKDLLQWCFVRATGGYSKAEYAAIVEGVEAAQNDDFFSGYVEFGRKISDSGEISLFYNYLENCSDIPGTSFKNHSVGIKLNYKF